MPDPTLPCHKQKHGLEQEFQIGQTRVHLTLQPLHVVINPQLVPAMIGFALLAADDGIMDFQKTLENQLDLAIASAQQNMASLMGQQQLVVEETLARMHLEVHLGGVHIVLPGATSSVDPAPWCCPSFAGG